MLKFKNLSQEDVKKLQELLKNPEFTEKLINLPTIEDAQKLLKDNGIEIIKEDLETLAKLINEVLKIDYENVSGGKMTAEDVGGYVGSKLGAAIGTFCGVAVGGAIGLYADDCNGDKMVGDTLKGILHADGGLKARDITGTVTGALTGAVTGAVGGGVAGAKYGKKLGVKVVKWFKG